MKLLHVDSSIAGARSASRQISATIVDRLVALAPGIEIARRDLAESPLPPFDAATLAAMFATAQLQPGEQEGAELRKRVLDEFLAADIVVVGAPMYNFTVAAQLKTWIDYLAIAGATFKYSPQGPVGLAGGKQVYIASSRGGIYTQGPAAVMDFQEPYLIAVFGFFGITDVTIVRAEGLKVSEEAGAAALAGALELAGQLTLPR